MGSSSYSKGSSYSGKNSSTESDTSSSIKSSKTGIKPEEVRPVRRKETISVKKEEKPAAEKSKMTKVFECIEKVENCRDNFNKKQYELDIAAKDLDDAEKELSTQIINLDTNTQDLLKDMISEIDNKDKKDIIR